MILYDTDYAEIYRQMSAEREKAKYNSQKHSREAIRKFERHRLPCEHHVIQTMPATHNTYMHYYYAAKEAEVRDNSVFFGNLLHGLLGRYRKMLGCRLDLNRLFYMPIPGLGVFEHALGDIKRAIITIVLAYTHPMDTPQ